ncbi:MAG: glycosyltransferase family 4 protein [Elusimicrobia bacterium]|nr:glycosyltransferase family 4 protein [Elusimicrobiota bacterium]
MRLLLVPDPTSPNGEDAFCREIAKRAPARGHSAAMQMVPNGPCEAAAELLAARGFAGDCDAVVINSLQPAALIAAKTASKPAVLRLIESYAGASPDALSEVKRLAAAATLLLLPSRHMAAVAAGWGVPENRMRVIAYAYDQIFAQQIALVTVRSSRARGFTIVTAGVVDAASLAGFETILSAVSRLRMDVHVTVIGDGPALPDLKTKAQALMLGDRATFLGELPHPKKMEYFRSAKAFVEPTGRQGFPSLALHALSEGCPVIGVRAGALPEFIRDGENGLLFAPGDAAALAEHIITLNTTPGLSLRLIAEGVRTVERHSWDATVAAALDAVETLAVKAS